MCADVVVFHVTWGMYDYTVSIIYLFVAKPRHRGFSPVLLLEVLLVFVHEYWYD